MKQNITTPSTIHNRSQPLILIIYWSNCRISDGKEVYLVDYSCEIRVIYSSPLTNFKSPLLNPWTHVDTCTSIRHYILDTKWDLTFAHYFLTIIYTNNDNERRITACATAMCNQNQRVGVNASWKWTQIVWTRPKFRPSFPKQTKNYCDKRVK